MEVTKIIEDFSGWNEWYQNNKINISSLPKDKYYPNQFIILKGHNCEDYGIVRENKVVRLKPDYNPCGISHKNPEQLFALQILKNKELPLKIITGSSGSGKTLLASAHAIQKLNSDKNKINKIIIAKSMTPVGREIGFLKGDMKEKTLPWLGPFLDNFIHCGYEPDDIELLIEHRRLEITPITYIQGRSISNAILIIDEVQNLDLNVVKQIITRAAEGTEVILLGDQSQVFERSVREKTLDMLVSKAMESDLIGVCELKQSIRSKIAHWAVENL